MHSVVKGNTHSKRLAGAFALRPVACCVMLACCDAALSNPTLPKVVNGAASFANPSASTLTVTNSPGTIINWQGFSIGAGEITRFVQQSGASAVLNRVVGADISKIQGQLLSNGRVFLINPAGILIGGGAVIDTAGFVGSTLDMSNADFLSGKLKFDGAGAGKVSNEGTIKASGDIYLVGQTVENLAGGVIRSENGNVVLAAGQSVTITSPQLDGVQFTLQAPSDSALNLGTIEAKNAVAMFAGTLRHSRDIRAGGMSTDAGGNIVLVAQKDLTIDAGSRLVASGASGGTVTVQSGGTTLVSGSVDATGSAGKGGTVHLLGERVGVIDSAVVDASGETGGGTILVGGDYQGKNTAVQNAQATYFSPAATLRADAINAGDGGKVILWADGATRSYGAISARGGARSGDGGFVETSGHYLDVTRGPDVSAPAGQGGNWLLDPANFEIISGGPGVPGNAGGSPNFTPTDPTANSTITDGTISDQLNRTATVTITTGPAAAGGTDGDIVFNTAGGNILISKASGPVLSTLRLNAHRNILFTGGGTTTFETTGTSALTVELNANANGVAADPALAGAIITNTANTVTVRTAAPVGPGPGALDPGEARIRILNGRTWDNNGVLNLANATNNAKAALDLFTGPFGTFVNHGTVNVGSIATSSIVSDANRDGLFANGGILNVERSTVWGTQFSQTGSGFLNINNANTVLDLQNGRVIDGTISFGDPTGVLRISEFHTTGALFDRNGMNGNGTLLIDGSGGPLAPQATFNNVNAPDLVLRVGNNGTATITGDPDPTRFGSIAIPSITTAGTLNVNAPTIVTNGVTVNAGMLGGTGTLTGSTLTWTGGTIAGAGQKTFFTINSSGGSPKTLTGALALDMTGPGTGTWNHASGTITQNDGGVVTLLNVSTVTNAGGATWELTSTADATPITGAGTFVNNGTFNKAGTAIATLSPDGFRNSGNVNVNAGTLIVPGAGTGAPADTGAWNVVIPGPVVTNTLKFNGTRGIAGSVNATGGGSGTAQVAFLSGDITITGGFGLAGAALGNVQQSGGNVFYNTGTPGGLTFSQAYRLSGGSLDGSDAITMPAGPTFEWSGGTVSGGPGVFTTQGPTTITGPVSLFARTWNNTGAVSQTGAGALTLSNNATVNNQAGGTWDLASTSTTPISGVGTFNNAGTFDNNGATVHTLSPTRFDNTGTVHVIGGTLAFNAPGTHTGNFDIDAGTQLEFVGGAHTFATGTIGGAGTLAVSGGSATFTTATIDDLGSLQAIGGGTVTVNATATVTGLDNVVTAGAGSITFDGPVTVNDAVNIGGLAATFNGLTAGGTLDLSAGTLTINTNNSTVAGTTTMTGGTLTGDAELRLNGSFAWSAGTVTSTGAGELVTAGSTNISDAVTLAGRTWTNVAGGTVDMTGPNGQLGLRDGGVVNNAGTWTLSSGSLTPIVFSAGAGNAFNNTNLFVKSTAVGVAANQSINTPFRNAGIVRIDGGSLTLGPETGTADSGTYNINANTASLVFISGRTLGVTSNVTGPGEMIFEGTSAIQGNYGIGTTGRTTIRNNGMALFDQAPGGPAGPVTIANLTLTGNGTLGGTRDLIASNVFNWSGGTVNGFGAFTTSGPNASINGNVTLDGRTWTNTGTVTHNDPFRLTLTNNAIVDNDGNWNVASLDPTPLFGGSGVNRFNNGDTLEFLGTGNRSIATSSFTNDGLTIVRGTLTLPAGNGTETGSYNVQGGGGTLIFAADRDLGVGSNVTGPGTVRFQNGTVTFGGSYAIANGGQTFIEGGTAVFNTAGPVTFAGNVLTISGGEMDGTANIFANDGLAWSGGTISGPSNTVLNTSGASTISGPVTLEVRAWNSAGTVNQPGAGVLTIANFSAVTNQAGGVWVLSGTDSTPIRGSFAFVNDGIFRNTGPTPHTIMSGFLNRNRVEVVDGALFTRSGGFPQFGIFDVSNNATLTFTGDYAFRNNSRVQGAGSVEFTGGNVTLVTFEGTAAASGLGTFIVSGGRVEFASTATFDVDRTTISGGALRLDNAGTTDTFNLTGGSLRGSMHVNTGGTWSGGTLGQAALEIAPGATFNLTGNALKIANNSTIINRGTTNLAGTGNLQLGGSSVFDNVGTFNMQTNAGVATQGAPASTFSNAGLLNKSGGGGTSVIATAFENTSTGTVHVSNGTLQVTGSFATNDGVIRTEPLTTFSTNGMPLTNSSTGAIIGNGTMDLGGAMLTNNGLVAPGASPGTLVIDGDYTQGPTGVLAIELAGPAQGVSYDLMEVTGVANLGGTLQVVTSGGFVPVAGESFDFMTYASHTGDFATKMFPTSSFQATPGATGYAAFVPAAPSNNSSSSSSNTGTMRDIVVEETQRLFENFDDVVSTRDAETQPKGRGSQVCN